jgi:hypothetical protein
MTIVTYMSFIINVLLSMSSSYMKRETLDMNFQGKNFRNYVHTQDVPLVLRHFQEGKQSCSIRMNSIEKRSYSMCLFVCFS